MYKQTVFGAHFKRYLPYRFQKRLTFNIAYRAADFGNNHICVGLLSDTVNKFFYFVGNVRDYLNR